MPSYSKHIYYGDDLKKVQEKFIQIYDMIEDLDYDTIYNNFVKLNALYKLNIVIYSLNDFLSSSNAYLYILPLCQKMLGFINYSKNNEDISTEDLDKINAFCEGQSELTLCQMQDGSTVQLTNLDYLYSYIYVKQMGVAGRYYMDYNIQYLEMDKPEKDYPPRERILEGALWWANQMLLNRFNLKMPNSDKYCEFRPKVLIFSTFPSSGKSYLCNTFNEMFAELGQIIMKSGGVLRVGNKEENILRQSEQTKNLIENNKRIFDCYPENREFIQASTGKYKPFAKMSGEEWGLLGCYYDPSTSIFTTRDSALNSIRCRVGMFDDPSRGQQECNNIEIHKQICELYNGDFSDRFKNQADKCVLLTGTMFNPFDVFSTEIEKAMSKGYEIDERFKNVYVCDGGNTIVIINDCEDEYGNSAYPEFITTEDLMDKKAGLSEYSYHCIWRQKPIPADGLLFSKEYLQFYDELDEANLSPTAKCYVDPTRRKASDFFSCPICRYNNKTKTWDMVDIIFEQSATRDLYDKIVNKIIQNKITEFVYEENIDATIGDMINQKLKERGITFCTVKTDYATVNKMQRILDSADTIKKNIRFPKCSEKTPMGFAVRQLTEFNGEKSVHDDFPDTLAGFANTYIINQQRDNYISGRKRPF